MVVKMLPLMVKGKEIPRGKKPEAKFVGLYIYIHAFAPGSVGNAEAQGRVRPGSTAVMVPGERRQTRCTYHDLSSRLGEFVT